jgi:hypothetical protein
MEELGNELVFTIFFTRTDVVDWTFKTTDVSPFSYDFSDLLDTPKFSI